MGFSNLVKVFLVLTLLFSTSLAFSFGNHVTITSDKPTYHCGFDVTPGQYSCEQVTLTIHSNRMYHNVHLEFPYDYKNGKISYFTHNHKKFFSKKHFDFFGKVNKEEVTLDSFDLMPGDTIITLTPIAYGEFKWDADLKDSNQNLLYSLDPWFNSSFLYRHELNLTSSSSTLTNFQQLIILNSSNINYSNTNDDGSDLRFTWLNQSSGNEQEIAYWIDNQSQGGWNESGNSYVWIKAPKIDTDGEQFYYYYGNTTEVEPKTNGDNVFLFFDDFDDNSVNSSKWVLKSGTMFTEENGEAKANVTAKISSVSTYPINSILDFKWKYNDGGWEEIGLSDMSSDSGIANDDNCVAFYGGGSGSHDGYLRNRASTSQSDSSAIVMPTSYNNAEIIWKSGETNFFDENSLKANLTTNVPTPNLYIGIGPADDGIYLKYLLLRKYSSDTITQSFGSEEEYKALKILSPLNNSKVFTQNVNLTFITAIGSNYNISIDGVFNKTITANADTWTEYYNLTAGNHSFYISLSTDASTNDSVNFTTKDFLITYVNYNSTEYELMYSSFNATIKHLSSINVTNYSMIYDGQTQSITLTQGDSETSYLTNTLLTSFIDTGTSKNASFTYSITGNDSSTDSYTNNQTLQIGYFISAASINPSTAIEGAPVTSNITVTKKTDYAIVKAYSNLSSDTQLATFNSKNGELNYYTSTNYAPAVTTQTNYTITYYITVTYGGTTATRPATINTTLTVNPIQIGYCGGTLNQTILNYSLWNEEEYTQQLPLSGGKNEWEAYIRATATNGTVTKTFGLTNDTQDLTICSNDYHLTLNTSVWAWENDTTSFVKRSHFMLNQQMSNQTMQIKIRTLNYSYASVIDFYVTDAYGNAVGDRIIHFYKYYPESNQYEEIFNLITDTQGHATAKLRAYDTWYKIMITNAAGLITKQIPITQISSNTYNIIEDLTTQYLNTYGISYTPSWNNQSKVFSLTINSNQQQDFTLKITAEGPLANSTYCTTSDTFSNGVLYCDLSSMSVTSFKWELSINFNGVNIPVAGGVQANNINTFGVAGLFALMFLVMGVALLFPNPTAKIIAVMVAVTVGQLTSLINITWFALIGLWFIAAILIYILKDRGLTS